MSDLDKEAIKSAIEEEIKKAEKDRQQAEWALSQAQANLKRAEHDKAMVLARLDAIDSLVAAVEEADAIASGFCGNGFRPSVGLRLELVQGLKEGDPMRMCHPSTPDRKIPLVLKILKEPPLVEFRRLDEPLDDWHALVILRRVKKVT